MEGRQLVRLAVGLLMVWAAAALVQTASEQAPAPVHILMALDSGARRAAALETLRRQEGRFVPLASGPAVAIPLGRPAVTVPILMYHYIRVNPDPRDTLGSNLSVTPDDFGRQLDWLAQNGYHPIDLSDLRAYLAGYHTLPDRPIVLTFDDGYKDMYTTAFPLLRAHHFKAVSYVVSGFLGAPPSVTADQVREMDANGIEIGAHTVSHADLTALSPSDLHHEVFDSKASLEALLGHPVLDFCYPYGKVNAAAAAVVQGAGFESATTTQLGTAHSTGDRFYWPRVRVNGGESLPAVVASLGQPEPAQLVQPEPAAAVAGPGLDHRPITFPLQAPPAAPPPVPPVAGPAP
jgi:peptidoglycan/xylan/chitin deacetylase (PgdA/CDA1 family)